MTITIRAAILGFLDNIKAGRSPKTYENYHADLLGGAGFLPMLRKYIKPSAPVSDLTEEMAAEYFEGLLRLGRSPATRQRRLAAVRGFYEYAAAHRYAKVTIERLNYLLKSGKLLTTVKQEIKFDEAKINRVLKYAASPAPLPDGPRDRLRQL